MKKYLVSVPTTISLSVTVRARSPKEALDLAAQASIMTLCDQCTRSEQNELVADSIDGDPDFDEAVVTDLETGADVSAAALADEKEEPKTTVKTRAKKGKHK
jgi:hypothetical protein